MNKKFIITILVASFVISYLLFTEIDGLTNQLPMNDDEIRTRVEHLYDAAVQSIVEKEEEAIVLFKTNKGLFEVAIDRETGRTSNLVLVQEATIAKQPATTDHVAVAVEKTPTQTEESKQPNNTTSKPTEGKENNPTSKPTEGKVNNPNNSNPTEGKENIPTSKPTAGKENITTSKPTAGKENNPTSKPTAGKENNTKPSNQQPSKKPTTSGTTEKPSKPATAIISEQRAIQIALKEQPGEVDSVDYEETNDGGYYEIEIEHDDAQTTFIIHAITGKILSVSFDN